ncbi:MAG: 50S ribosomal protein L21 [Gammaproteobacteria bacterium]|nr:50S ribosomal protein L21 [Gammaproteobacteria bacterium]
MYAVFESGGKQHRAAEGDVLSLELLEAAPGDEVAFENVMLICKEEAVSVGTPFLPNGRVLATVVRHERQKKIRVVKFKRRKNYLRRAGHRQRVTLVKVTSIEN